MTESSGRSGGVRRGDVYIIDLGHPIGHEQGFKRPCVVISRDEVNANRNECAIVVPVTTVDRGVRSHIPIDPQSAGLRARSYARVEDVTAVSLRRFVRRLGRATPSELARIIQVLMFLVDGDGEAVPSV